MGKTNDIVTFAVEVNGSKAHKELGKLEKSTQRLGNKKKKLETQLKKVNKEFGDESEESKNLQSQIDRLSKAIDKNDRKSTKLRKGIGINNMSMIELRRTSRSLQLQLDKTSKASNPKQYQILEKELHQVKRKMDKLRTSSKSLNQRFCTFLNTMLGFSAANIVSNVISGIFTSITDGFKAVTETEGENRRASIVLGDSLGYVKNQAEKLSDKMGVTNQQFKSMVTNTADLLVPLGFNRKESAKLSVELQGLTGALDEWTSGQIGAKGVSEILTKAMLGENEQLKQLGIAIRQDSDEYRELVKLKLKDGTRTKAQAQALATLELIQKKSADAQTAYVSGGNKLYRFQKKITKGWNDMKQSLVNLFVETDEVKTLNESISAYASLDKELNGLINKYDNLKNKSNLSKEEQLELSKVITRIGEITPSAITQMDKYGKTLDINTGAAKRFLDAEKARLSLENKDVIEDTESKISSLKGYIAMLQRNIVEYNNQGFTPEALVRETTADKDSNWLTKWLKSRKVFAKKGTEEYNKVINELKTKITNKERELLGEQSRLSKMSGKSLDEIIGDKQKEPENLNEPTEKYKKDELLKIKQEIRVTNKVIYEGNEELDKFYSELEKELDEQANFEVDKFQKEIDEKQKIKDEELEGEKKHANNVKKIVNQLSLHRLNKALEDAQTAEQLKNKRIALAEEEYKQALENGQHLEIAQDNLNKKKHNAEKQFFEDKHTILKEQGELSLSIEQELLKKQLDAKLISEKEFQDQKAELERNYRQQNFQEAQSFHSENIAPFQQASANLVSSLKDLDSKEEENRHNKELKALKSKFEKGLISEKEYNEAVEAENNKHEAKQLDLKKKYADLDFAVKVSQIISSTSLAIMQAYAQLGPIAGSIAAGLVGATGAIQLAAANKERENVKALGAESGGYTEVIRAQDGKRFDAKKQGNKRGYINETSLLVSEAGGEFVANNKAINNPTVKPFLDIINTAQMSNQISTLNMFDVINSKGYNKGGYTQNYTSLPIDNLYESDDSLIKELSTIKDKLDTIVVNTRSSVGIRDLNNVIKKLDKRDKLINEFTKL